MSSAETKSPAPKVIVIADILSNAQGIINRILAPAGIQAWRDDDQAPAPDVLVVDISQMRGDPLAGLRARRGQGDEAPAVVLAAHFPASRLRDLFRLGVADILLKPSPRRRNGIRPAAQWMAEHRKEIVDKVTYWTGVRRPLVKALVGSVEQRVQALGLAVETARESSQLVELTAYATTLAMNYLARGRFVQP